jgi:hypothetical protein
MLTINKSLYRPNLLILTHWSGKKIFFWAINKILFVSPFRTTNKSPRPKKIYCLIWWIFFEYFFSFVLCTSTLVWMISVAPVTPTAIRRVPSAFSLFFRTWRDRRPKRHVFYGEKNMLAFVRRSWRLHSDYAANCTAFIHCDCLRSVGVCTAF